MGNDGRPSGPDFTILETVEQQQMPAVAGNGAGRYLLAWQDDRNGDWDIYASLFQPLRAGFAAMPTVGTVPLNVAFADQAIPDGVVDEWLWSLGDGMTSTLASPVHTYTVPGIYTVTQWVTDTDSGEADVLTRTQYVTVTPGEVIITYDYDPLYRLVTATYSSGEVFTYTYDKVGNRLKMGTNGEVTGYAYDKANRLTSVDGVSYTWDYNGNLLADDVRTYEYDYANRLVEVVSGIVTTQFTYNGDGHRMARTEDGTTTTYVVAVLGLSQVLAETTGGETTRYVYGHDLLAEKDGSAWAWHLGDGLGSVRQLTDGSGQVTLAQGYTPFGVPLWHAGSGVTGYGFTGERWEAYSELLFLRARYYEPGMGRFINKDPWTGSVWLPQTLHRYSYVLNNPPTYVDPSGHQQQFPMVDEVYSPGYQGPISEGPKLPETRYWVSEDYGFFDKSHINTGRPAERLQEIEALVGTCKTGESTFRARVKAGPVDGEFVGTYKVFGDKIELGQVNGVFLAMYEDWSIRFETWEGSLGVWFIRPGAGTSFAVEDLPTHYVAAVMAIQDISKEDVFFGYLGGVTGSDEEPSRDIKNMEFTPLVPIDPHKWLRQSWPPQMVVTPIVDPGLWCPVSFVGYVQGVPVYDEDTWGKIEE